MVDHRDQKLLHFEPKTTNVTANDDQLNRKNAIYQK